VLKRPTRDSSARVNTPFDLPVRLDLRLEAKAERDQNLRCNSLEAAQISSLSGCNAGFLFPSLIPRFVLKSAGTYRRPIHVDVDYDGGREFEASNVVSLYYEGKPGSRLRRVDIGNISFAPPSSRFLTSSLPSGNYGAQAIAQFGRLQFKAIFAQQTGNIVQSHRYLVDPRARQINQRDVEDRAIEPRRFFFTVDPALFRAYPNIDILNRSQLEALRGSLPDTLRPSRVLLYRVQFGTSAAKPERAAVPAAGRGRPRSPDLRSAPRRCGLLHGQVHALVRARARAE
jgi:cell surface protein SprA